MTAPKFRLEVSFSESTGEPVAAYVRLRIGKVARTAEVSPGVAFADFDAEGALLGVELLEPCGPEILDPLIENESEQVRQLLRRGVHKDMIRA